MAEVAWMTGSEAGKENPRVSVIIPCYNVEQYVIQCVDSVVNQTLKDIEIIIVNDGSTDGTRDRLKKYEGLGNVTIIDRENGGLSVARNEGLDRAVGEYVYFLDSDDYIDTDVLERAVDRMDKDGLDQLIINARNFRDGEPDRVIWEMYPESCDGIYTGRDMLVMLCNRNRYMASVPYRMLKRDLLVKCDISFYEGIIHEDELFTYRVMMKSERTALDNGIIYHRRIRPGSITQDVDYGKRWKGMFRVVSEIDAGNYCKGVTDDQLEVMDELVLHRLGVALNAYAHMGRSLRREERHNHRQLLALAKKNGYYGSVYMRCVCVFWRIYGVAVRVMGK
jgi:glycosyltransferase involved in cell wall biosynthesis